MISFLPRERGFVEKPGGILALITSRFHPGISKNWPPDPRISGGGGADSDWGAVAHCLPTAFKGAKTPESFVNRPFIFLAKKRAWRNQIHADTENG